MKRRSTELARAEDKAARLGVRLLALTVRREVLWRSPLDLAKAFVMTERVMKASRAYATAELHVRELRKAKSKGGKRA